MASYEATRTTPNIGALDLNRVPGTAARDDKGISEIGFNDHGAELAIRLRSAVDGSAAIEFLDRSAVAKMHEYLGAWLGKGTKPRTVSEPRDTAPIEEAGGPAYDGETVTVAEAERLLAERKTA
jgi:hypothetical protein